jgi:hypothetical protein
MLNRRRCRTTGAAVWHVLLLLVCGLSVHVADAAAAPGVVAGVGVRAAQGRPLRGQVLTGATDVWVSGVSQARSALLGLDRKPAAKGPNRIRLTLHRKALRPWALDTTKLKDGVHVLYARVTRRHGRAVRLKAVFRVENQGARSDQLIATALAQHKIDLGTSLVYRFYAFLGDSRLPAAYRGAPPADDMVAMDARAALTAGKVKGKEAALLKPSCCAPPTRSRPSTSPAAARPARGPQRPGHARRRRRRRRSARVTGRPGRGRTLGTPRSRARTSGCRSWRRPTSPRRSPTWASRRPMDP